MAGVLFFVYTMEDSATLYRYNSCDTFTVCGKKNIRYTPQCFCNHFPAIAVFIFLTFMVNFFNIIVQKH